MQKSGIKTLRVVIFLFLLPVFVVAAALVSFNWLDPYRVTDEYLSARVVRVVHAITKMGARVEVTVVTDDGIERWYTIPGPFTAKAGETVRLRVYERERTGWKRYVLAP